ncbi:hypothetical protein [Saccharicrinis sp. 156]|uniref:hypothetical protein n=1 Tax=Saccharicrinis sp. 156 TaxID=3417574 RepID=UPI003D358D6C
MPYLQEMAGLSHWIMVIQSIQRYFMPSRKSFLTVWPPVGIKSKKGESGEIELLADSESFLLYEMKNFWNSSSKMVFASERICGLQW